MINHPFSPKLKALLAIAATGLLFNTAARAAITTWLGAGYADINTSTDVNDPANWDNGVPGSSDTAVFEYTTLGGATDADVYITSAATNFNPSRIEWNTNTYAISTDIHVAKDLNLSSGLKIVGYSSSGGSGSVHTNRFYIDAGATLQLDNLDFSQNSIGWGFFNMGAGDDNPGNSAVMEFTGSNILFATPSNSYTNRLTNINSNPGEVENATNDKAPQMRFTNPGATITLEQAALRTSGTIALGLVHLDVRSDQTWIADDLAFVTMNGSIGASGMAGRYVVESIDGGRLDNLGELNIKMSGLNSSSIGSAIQGMRLYGGTYGSLIMQSTGTSGRDMRINMTDDSSLVGNAVNFDVDGNPYQSAYGLILRNSDDNADAQLFDLQGNNLVIQNGLLIEDTAPAASAGKSYNLDPLNVILSGGSLTVNGNIVMAASPGRSPGDPAVNGPEGPNPNIGITGGGSGGSVTLGGSWNVQVVADDGQENLSNSTLTMTGGTPGDLVTFEVGDAADTTGVQAGTWSIGTMVIGNGISDTAYVKLVNDYLNNNPWNTDTATSKAGEKLIVGTLSIGEGSTLDANLAEVSVEIGSSTLILAEGAVLDLNTGLSLSGGMIIDNFIGLGDQTLSWAGFQSQVIDSSNAGFGFVPVLNGGGNTVWQAVPEPATMAFLLGLGALGLAAWRRRR